MPAPSHPTIAARLGRLDALGRDDLAAEWASAFGVPAPCKASREFLLKAMAHRAQVEATRDLRPAVRKALLQIARGLRDGTAAPELPALAPTLKPGSRLIRAWRGETHEVTVSPDGRFAVSVAAPACRASGSSRRRSCAKWRAASATATSGWR